MNFKHEFDIGRPAAAIEPESSKAEWLIDSAIGIVAILITLTWLFVLGWGAVHLFRMLKPWALSA
jgi:hypothetical protein